MQLPSKNKILIFSNYDWTIYKFRISLIEELKKIYDIVIITKRTEKNFLKNQDFRIIYVDYDIYNLNIK